MTRRLIQIVKKREFMLVRSCHYYIKILCESLYYEYLQNKKKTMNEKETKYKRKISYKNIHRNRPNNDKENVVLSINVNKVKENINEDYSNQTKETNGDQILIQPTPSNLDILQRLVRRYLFKKERQKDDCTGKFKKNHYKNLNHFVNKI